MMLLKERRPPLRREAWRARGEGTSVSVTAHEGWDWALGLSASRVCVRRLRVSVSGLCTNGFCVLSRLDGVKCGWRVEKRGRVCFQTAGSRCYATSGVGIGVVVGILCPSAPRAPFAIGEKRLGAVLQGCILKQTFKDDFVAFYN